MCAQAGNVNTGACDPLRPIVAAAHEAGAWVHVDGAFGLWAAASPALRHLVAGTTGADSWAVDAHKWLNVPYDCGLAIVADAEAHAAAMSATADYLRRATTGSPARRRCPAAGARSPSTPRCATSGARAGRAGRALLRARARGWRRAMEGVEGAAVLNDVVLNQVLRALRRRRRRTAGDRGASSAAARRGSAGPSGTGVGRGARVVLELVDDGTPTAAPPRSGGCCRARRAVR